MVVLECMTPDFGVHLVPKEEASLQELGFDGSDELLALVSDVLVGDFEFCIPVYSGCPCCGFNFEIQSVQFCADGTALIQAEPWEGTRRFLYKLGELRGAERELEFEEAADVTPPAVYAGTLYVSTTDPMYRRVKIPELGIDVEDVQYLKQQDRTALQQKLEFFFSHPHFNHSRDWVMQNLGDDMKPQKGLWFIIIP